jgi:hypothetical protein
MTSLRTNGKGRMMNIPSVLKLIVKVLFPGNLYAEDHAKTEWWKRNIALVQMPWNPSRNCETLTQR